MASVTARVISYVMGKTGFFRRLPTDMSDFAGFQAKQLNSANGPSIKNHRSCLIEESAFLGRTIWTLSPNNQAAKVFVLYWHGGAYIYPPTSAHWDFLARMTAMYGWHITVPLYPLAPHSTMEYTTDFALNFMRYWMAQPITGQRIVAGDSAGGGLAAATLIAARNNGVTMPSKAILISPWLKLIPNHPDQREIEPHDAILSIKGLRAAGDMYIGEMGSNDLRANPLQDDWSNLPPLLVFGGGNDILVTDTRTLKSNLPDIIYEEHEDMMHDWPILFFPESRKAQEEMANFATKAL
jgi:acetyl esterase/lipase